MEHKKILYVDMDGVLVNFESAFPHFPDHQLQEYAGHLDDLPGIFSQMDPMDHAIESYKTLSSLFDTYILSTAPWNNPSAWIDKVVWVRKHLGAHAEKRLIITSHKNLNKGHFLIDDRTKNGAGQFEGELILFGSEKFPNWDAVMKYLLPKSQND